MIVDFFYENPSYKIFSEEKVISLLSLISNLEKSELGEIDIQIVSDKKILEINQEFLNHDYFTDIITFDNSLLNIINGELIISFDTVKSNARKYGIIDTQEMYRVIIHGIMHLNGYNDSSESEKSLMTEKENEYLSYLEKI
ncbi:MAG: rRNA maturation RNase YbeY [Bacteroidales bacterium]|nr:rRNA maturation RNase YbeY [Bacteroidales bacterium]MBN2821553.1 rRNA maturation RNase YbeY [Bacteroidales bacterium]